MSLFLTEKGDFELLIYSDAKLLQNEQTHKDIGKIVNQFDKFLLEATVWVQKHCDLRWEEDRNSDDTAAQERYLKKVEKWYGHKGKGGVGPTELDSLLKRVRNYYTKGQGRNFSAAFPKPKRPNYDPDAEIQSIYYQQHCLLEWCVRIAYAPEYLERLLPTGAGARKLECHPTLSYYMSSIVWKVKEEEGVD